MINSLNLALKKKSLKQMTMSEIRTLYQANKELMTIFINKLRLIKKPLLWIKKPIANNLKKLVV